MGIGLPLEQQGNDGNGSSSGHVRVYNAFGVKISGNAGFRMLSAPVSNGTYSDLLSELWTQGMTGSDAAEASGDNVWTWTVGSGGAGSWSVVSDLGNTMTAGAGILVYAFADNNNDGTDDLPVALSVVVQKAVEMYVILRVLEPLRMVDMVLQATPTIRLLTGMM